jgi:predicted ribosome quality control (RQC) complex YloA/Tae2 family protein
MTYQSELSRGMAEAALTDPESGEPVKISLNPQLTPVENAQSLYKRAKRLRRGRPIVERRLARLERERACLKAGRDALEEGRAPSEEALALIPLPVSLGAPAPPTAPRVFQIHGYTVEVGKDAAQNDALLRKARPDDLWLHAKGVPGSHVIVHRGGRAEIPRAVIEEAARLAAQFSKAKGEKRVQVSTALAKHVRKPKGSPPGLVILTQEDTLTVEPTRKGNFG